MNKKILVTGAAGFIGMHLVKALAEAGYEVVGIDNLNDYYDPRLKERRLGQLGISTGNFAKPVVSDMYPQFTFLKTDIRDRAALHKLFSLYPFACVVHLAAQAGVRYSLTHPESYIDNNLTGFFNVLEASRAAGVQHFLYASSSSVYGMNRDIPFSTQAKVDQPVSLYAATKKSNELMAYTYSHLYKMPVTGLRFFTVYGPWYRPDMAMYLFADAICSGKPIKVFNNGEMRRDFTYIDDITGAMLRLLDKPPGPGTAGKKDQNPYYRVLNIGSHSPVNLLDMITILEEKIGRKAQKEYLPMQPGDVPVTFADIDDLVQLTGFSPQTPLSTGIGAFADWYKEYHTCGEEQAV